MLPPGVLWLTQRHSSSTLPPFAASTSLTSSTATSWPRTWPFSSLIGVESFTGREQTRNERRGLGVVSVGGGVVVITTTWVRKERFVVGKGRLYSLEQRLISSRTGNKKKRDNILEEAVCREAQTDQLRSERPSPVANSPFSSLTIVARVLTYSACKPEVRQHPSNNPPPCSPSSPPAPYASPRASPKIRHKSPNC